MRGDALRERVFAEKLIGTVQGFAVSELEDDPILRGIDKNDPVARNPCLHRGPLSLDYLDTPSGPALAFDVRARRRKLNQVSRYGMARG